MKGKITRREALGGAAGAALGLLLKSEAHAQNFPKATGYINLKDFGAVGDGIANDTQAFLSAIANRVNTILVPEGTYKISKTLSLPSNTYLYGAGGRSFIIRDTTVQPFDMIEIKGESHITIEDLTIDGIQKEDIVVPKNRFCGIRVWKGNAANRPTDITIKNVRIDRTTHGEIQPEGNRGALALEDCYDIRIHGFKGWNNRGTSILIWGKSEQIIISDSWFSGEILPYSSTFNAGLPIGSGISGRFKQDVTVANCIAFNHGYTNISMSGKRGVILGNISYGSKYAGITIGHNVNASKADETICMGNLIYNNKLEGIHCANSSDVLIANNIIRSNGIGGNRGGIRLYWSSSQDDIKGNSHVMITGNKIYDNKTQGILVEWGTDHLINNNIIENNGAAGIYFNGSSINQGSDLNHCIVTNNFIKDNGVAGILGAGNDIREMLIVAKDNVIRSTDSVKQPVGIWSTKNNNFQVEGNIFSSNYNGASNYSANSAMKSNSGGLFRKIKDFPVDTGDNSLKYISANN